MLGRIVDKLGLEGVYTVFIGCILAGITVLAIIFPVFGIIIFVLFCIFILCMIYEMLSVWKRT